MNSLNDIILKELKQYIKLHTKNHNYTGELKHLITYQRIYYRTYKK